MVQAEIGREYPEEGEQESINGIIESVKRNLTRVYKKGHENRQFHAKMHACIKGTFHIANDLPADMQVGTFVSGKSYDCWVRLSNGNTRVVDDRKADLRGFAIKIAGVQGEQVVKDISMPATHDLLLVSYPTLLAASIKDFKKSIDAICNGIGGLILFTINPFNWGIVKRTLNSMKKHDNLFAVPYWSVTPYRYGNGNKAIKYKLVPTTTNLTKPAHKHATFLQDTIVADLAKQDITFDLMVQLQQDAVLDPMEDPTKEWSGPFTRIGTLVLPKQRFVPADTQEFGDNLTYSPWHCTKEHQPLGAINRARKATYDAIAKFRIEHNKKTTTL
ncbi:MAG: hypothetical protein JWQ38_3745 [Flavipsychrobacter sp.]|nr:hypothetical protein [Flavipsychrobacter sp.]